MNIYECQVYAQDNGFDSLEFSILVPNGNLVKCKWLDAYFGFVSIEGREDTFVQVSQIAEAFPNHECLLLEVEHT